MLRPIIVGKNVATLHWIAPEILMWPQLSCCDAIGTSAFRNGDRSVAGSVWVNPGYETPNVPTCPSHQGWRPTHSCVSKPSLSSHMYGSHTPSLSWRPRQS